MRVSLAGLMLAVLVAFPSLAADAPLAWPQFRGPDGSAVADQENPPVEVGSDKNVKWKIPVPSGLSSPIVAGDNLVLTAFENDKLYTIAYNRATGKEVWRAEAPAKTIEPYYKPEGSPAASTPVTDGERIISYFGSCGLVAYDLAGKELWRYEMPIASTPGDFGTGTSPILADGLVIVVRDEMKNSRIVAVDATTGEKKWETKRSSPASYCTPVAWETPGGKQVAAAGHGRMVGYDLATGAEKWTFAGLPSSCCPSPVVADGKLFFAGWSPGGPDDPMSSMPSFDDTLKGIDANKDQKIAREEAAPTPFKDFFTSMDGDANGFVTRDEWDLVLKFMAEGKNIAFSLAPGAAGDVTDKAVWKQTKGLPYIASAILYRGQYVMLKDGGIVTALDPATGKELYMKRAIPSGTYYASPVAAGGHIYCVTLADGAITVLKGGTKSPEVVAQNSPLGEKVGATPAIADDTLYVRTDKHLYAFGKAK